MTIHLGLQDRQLVELTLEDLQHTARESVPHCDDHQLRRVSVQLRNLLIEDWLVRSWKLCQMQPKSPVIIAPRLRTEGLGPNDLAVAGGGNVGHGNIGNFRFTKGASSPEEIRERYEQGKRDIEYQFSLSDYKESCAVYIHGQKVSRRQVVQYVANKKGGAHLDNVRKKDEQVYTALDAAIESGLWFGGDADHGSKNAVYLEMISIGQSLTNSPDILRFMEFAPSVLMR
jgi:hypothetical protein